MKVLSAVYLNKKKDTTESYVHTLHLQCNSISLLYTAIYYIKLKPDAGLVHNIEYNTQIQEHTETTSYSTQFERENCARDLLPHILGFYYYYVSVYIWSILCSP